MTTPHITNYLSRADLNLQYPKPGMVPFPPNAVDGIVFHHTTGDTLGSAESDMAWWRNIQSFHMFTRGWLDIGYHACITRTGMFFGGRDAHYVGAHCVADGQNWHTVGVALLGDGSSPSFWTPEALDAAAWVVDLVDFVTGREVAVSGHRDHAATECNGELFYAALDELRARAWRNVTAAVAPAAPMDIAYHMDPPSITTAAAAPPVESA